jgi:hypothetical protein
MALMFESGQTVVFTGDSITDLRAARRGASAGQRLRAHGGGPDHMPLSFANRCTSIAA